MNLKADSDEALMKAVTEKNIAALEELFDRYHPAVLAVAYRVLGDRQLAEDVIQDTFLAVWRQVETFKPGLGTARTWLLGIARHQAIDITRRRALTTQNLPPDELIVEADHDVGKEVVQRLGRERIRQAIEALPAERGGEEPTIPERLSLQDIIQVLRNTPHAPYKRSPEVVAALESLLQQIDEEQGDETSEVIQDASSNLDKYIYG